MTINCSVAGTTSAVCTGIGDGPEANFPGTIISTIQQSEMSYLPVTITAGSVTSVAATASATTTTESGSKATTSAAQTASKSSASSSGSSSSSSAVSTGGMPQITGDAAHEYAWLPHPPVLNLLSYFVQGLCDPHLNARGLICIVTWSLFRCIISFVSCSCFVRLRK
ncbi:unnamed protein product [Aspergillus oryzae RIB40]|uniref:DNA, SC010 n=1 Tax=Aspergillus oryzae (strain ATCC 42149 / RIB 40) TaxID=510516 RepID=Q2TW74_ASPOR|nr:unnamed protein product [Aspergillus oryzae RIB40]BAE66499.1 unnamed protein product [Aspergillus oryzae RIB40]